VARRAAVGAALTAGIWLTVFGYVGFGLAAVPALPATPSAAMLTWALVMAAITVLPTPGFLGSYEAGAVAALTVLGAPPDAAAVYALGLHVAYLGFVAAVGIPALGWVRWDGPDPAAGPSSSTVGPEARR
ncbi:MAG: lysylphosphatidylglycerol synthase domain-containing protein, partial [Myxococcota bacterium]